MWRWVVTRLVTFVAPIIIASICGLSSGCSDLLGITSITAADGATKDATGDDSAADRPMGGNNFCDRAFWKATASARGDGPGPSGGIDGDLETRWNTERLQDGTDWYQVDLGGPVKLSKITLNNTQHYPDDYPGRYEVYGSSDGITFDSSPFVSGSGAVSATAINFPQRTVRAVKIKQVGTTNRNHWFGISEFQISCQP